MVEHNNQPETDPAESHPHLTLTIRELPGDTPANPYVPQKSDRRVRGLQRTPLTLKRDSFRNKDVVLTRQIRIGVPEFFQ